jgi:DNA-binding YbaB/EbfC family protein
MFNMGQLMKQAQEMQKKMQNMQDELAKSEFEGKAGGGVVVIKVNGKNEMQKISIDESLLSPSEKDILEDLIVAAYNDAKQKAEANSESIKSNMFGGMGLPPGFKMPF